MAEDPTEVAVRNLVTLRRLSNGLARDVRQQVRSLIDAYIAELARVDPTGVTRDRYRKQRVAKLLVEIDAINKQRYPEIRRLIESTAAGVGQQQAQYAQKALQSMVGAVEIGPGAGLGSSYFREILRTDPFDGDTLALWVQRHRTSTVNAVRRQIQLGMVQGETLQDIVRRIRGRSAGGGRFTGGVLATSTREAEGVARTAINYIANRGQLAFFEQQKDIVEQVEFTATLDSRTTPICARWDGTVFDVDDPKKQVPPLHFNCRSILVPVVNWESLGIDPPEEGTRASADGPVPSSTTYEEWFKGQSAETQASIIGRTRADLFRKGELTFREMIGRDNRVLTLDEIMG